MMQNLPPCIKEITCIDFEFQPSNNGIKEVICMVAKQLISGRIINLTAKELLELKHPPFSIDEDNVIVAYFLSAEMDCFLALGWPLPYHVVDLYVEFRNHTNGKLNCEGRGLIAALRYFKLDAIDYSLKESMRDLVYSDNYNYRKTTTIITSFLAKKY
jgi:hypothetical protein